jgi:hypothetical protein
LFTLSINFDENDKDPNERKKMGKAPFEKGGEEVKQFLGPMHATNV